MFEQAILFFFAPVQDLSHTNFQGVKPTLKVELDLLLGGVILTQNCLVQLFFAELFLILQGLF